MHVCMREIGSPRFGGLLYGVGGAGGRVLCACGCQQAVSRLPVPLYSTAYNMYIKIKFRAKLSRLSQDHSCLSCPTVAANAKS